jgi:hypothetical protein
MSQATWVSKNWLIPYSRNFFTCVLDLTTFVLQICHESRIDGCGFLKTMTLHVNERYCTVAGRFDHRSQMSLMNYVGHIDRRYGRCEFWYAWYPHG